MKAIATITIGFLACSRADQSFLNSILQNAQNQIDSAMNTANVHIASA